MWGLGKDRLRRNIRWSRVAAIGTSAVVTSPALIVFEFLAFVLLLVVLVFVRDGSRRWIGEVCIGLGVAVVPYSLLFGLVSLLG